MSHPDNGQFFKNCTFNSFFRLLGPQIVPPTAPDWFESISRVQCKSRIKSWDDDVTTWSLKDHVVTLCLRTISVRLKSECIQKLIKHLYFVHLFRYPAKKKSENVGWHVAGHMAVDWQKMGKKIKLKNLLNLYLFEWNFSL